MKKVFYILNFLFLTLLVSGGSVFAAAPPTQYIDEKGNTQDIEDESVVPFVTTTNTNASTGLSNGWYYIDSTQGTASSMICLAPNSEVNVVIVGSPTLNLNGNAIFVPSGATLNFYAEPNNKGTAEDVSLNLTGNNASFLIGNYNGGTTYYGYSTNDFGNIAFNSGTYNIVNKSTSAPAIGSNTTSGGTITVNAAANVTTFNYGVNTVSIGVSDPTKTCTIEVTGGFLNSQFESTSSSQRTFPVSAGSKGNIIINGQGKILSSVNPNESGENGTWTINSGIAGYSVGYPSINNQWATVVGGTVNLPVAEGVLQQNLDPPTNALNGCWGLLTVNPGAVLNLGTTDPDGTTNEATLLVGFDYGIPTTPATVNNYGTVNVIDLSQNSGIRDIYPSQWNNNPGSTLTINSGATLSIYTNGFNNSAQDQGQSAGEVTINGTLNLSNYAPLTNNGNLTIAQGGKITGVEPNTTTVTGAGTIKNNQEGTVILDGTITLDDANTISFQNYGTLDIGPIGQVVTTATQGSGAPTGGQLTNNAGGTVTSQNPCYYGNQVYSGMSVNPFVLDPM